MKCISKRGIANFQLSGSTGRGDGGCFFDDRQSPSGRVSLGYKERD